MTSALQVGKVLSALTALNVPDQPHLGPLPTPPCPCGPGAQYKISPGLGFLWLCIMDANFSRDLGLLLSLSATLLPASVTFVCMLWYGFWFCVCSVWVFCLFVVVGSGFCFSYVKVPGLGEYFSILVLVFYQAY